MKATAVGVTVLVSWCLLAWSGKSLGSADCAAMAACPVPSSEHIAANMTVLIELENCCWNGTQPQRSIVVETTGSTVQRIVVSLRRVVAVNLRYLVCASDNQQNATQPASSGIMEIVIADSYIELANKGAFFFAFSWSAASISILMTRTAVIQVDNTVSTNSGATAGLLLALTAVKVNSTTISVLNSTVICTSTDTRFIVLAQAMTSLSANVRPALYIQFLASVVNASAASVVQSLNVSSAVQFVVWIDSSVVTGNVSLVGSKFAILSVRNSKLVELIRSNADDFCIQVVDSLVVLSSYGDMYPNDTTREATVLSFTNTNVSRSVVTLHNVNVTLTVASGGVSSLSSNTTWTDASLINFYGLRGCNVSIRNVFLRSRAIGGNIKPLAADPRTT